METRKTKSYFRATATATGKLLGVHWMASRHPEGWRIEQEDQGSAISVIRDGMTAVEFELFCAGIRYGIMSFKRTRRKGARR